MSSEEGRNNTVNVSSFMNNRSLTTSEMFHSKRIWFIIITLITVFSLSAWVMIERYERKEDITVILENYDHFEKRDVSLLVEMQRTNYSHFYEEDQSSWIFEEPKEKKLFRLLLTPPRMFEEEHTDGNQNDNSFVMHDAQIWINPEDESDYLIFLKKYAVHSYQEQEFYDAIVKEFSATREVAKASS